MLHTFFIFSFLFFMNFSLHGVSSNLQQNPILSKGPSLPNYGTKDFANSIPYLRPPMLNQKATIIVDPGHGGHDVGTQSVTKPRYQEKSLNLVTSRYLRDYLQYLGYTVILTRDEDIFVSLDQRASFANAQKPDVFVSIHYNSAPSAEAEGVEVFFYLSKDNKIRSQKSKKLALAVLNHVIAESSAKSRGVKHGNYAVIRETNMPAILLEGGFVTNAEEMQRLKDPNYLKMLAWGIAQGIDDFLKKKKK